MGKFKLWISSLFNNAEANMFPHYCCPFCGKETLDGKLCDKCENNKISGAICALCGLPIGQNENVCMGCKQDGRSFTCHRSVMVYNSATSPAIVRLKFSGAKYLAEDFAKLLAEKFAEQDWKIDLVCPVPSHKNRIKQRGYNQAEEIAKHFCNITGLTFMALLAKDKDTAHQTGMNRAGRLSNLKGSLSVTDKWACKGHNILVIDDVMTTGSTLETCATVLAKAGASKVYCLTVARTPSSQD